MNFDGLPSGLYMRLFGGQLSHRFGQRVRKPPYNIYKAYAIVVSRPAIA